jgi:NADH:ubiquinone reductase (H+-translocating)
VPPPEPPPAALDDYLHVVIVGAGFAGLACAAKFGGTNIRVTIIDRQNYHLFVPLLYQVATAALSPAEIAEPVRKILSRYWNIDVMLAEVTGVDPGHRTVLTADGDAVTYDRLVIATGSLYSYFGHDDWAQIAPGLKSIEDARQIRARLLMSFEKAEMSADPEEQKALMTTVIVGGGPTGVEMAGAIAELARYTLARDFRRIDPRSASILLVEAAPRILGVFPESLAAYAHAALERKGVAVLTQHAVEKIEPGGVTMNGRFVPAGTVIWGAGVKASSAGQWLGVETDRAGRIRVNPDLSVPGLDGVYALGDTVLMLDDHGSPLPGLAQVAKQQGNHLGRVLAANVLRGEPMPPFRFKNRGNTAVIGRNAAIFDFGKWHLKGWFAWILWAIIHVYLLIGFENRMLVSMQWLWRYLTYERGARLIATSAPMPSRKTAPAAQGVVASRGRESAASLRAPVSR